MKIFTTLAALFRKKRPKPEVVVHAPAPRDLDSPFADEKAQQRVGNAIAASMAKPADKPAR
jgi:hypothetical protein